MAIRLIILDNENPDGGHVRTFVQDRIVIGRSRSSDICLPDMSVSTRHAEIRLAGTEYVLTDLESMNGSCVNDKAVLSFQRRALHSGDVIQIADFSIRVELGVGPGPDEPRDVSVRQAREMLARLSDRRGVLSDMLTLTVTAGPCRGVRIALEAGARAVVGRGSESHLVLDDRDVSRAHAELVAEKDCVKVIDLGSKNGILVDGARVERATLTFGRSCTLGKSTLMLDHPADAMLGAIFEAPEEETSSFSPMARSSAVVNTSSDPDDDLPLAEQTQSAARRGTSENPPNVESPSSPPKVSPGPTDPLVGEEEPPPSWHTAEQSRLAVKKDAEGSDMGLIIIGIILLLAATAGLAYLFH